MSDLLMIIQIVLSVLLCLTILAQNKGVGLSETFGGSGNVYSSKRGLDKVLHYGTILLAILLAVNTLAFAFVS